MLELVAFAVVTFCVGAAVGMIVRPFLFTSTTIDSNDPIRSKQLLQTFHQSALTLLRDVREHAETIEGASDDIQHAIDSDADPMKVIVLAVAKIAAANKRLKQKLESAESTIREQTQLLEATATEARTDALTTLANRRAFDEKLRQLFGISISEQPLSVVMVDIDYFKRFNDKHGHSTGDAVLRGVAQVLAACVRKTDIAARYGGEEFAVILPNVSGADVQKVSENIRTKLATSTFRCENVDHEVTVSIGCAERQANDTEATVMKRADVALYAAKAGGRNTVRFHDTKQAVPLKDLMPLPKKQVYRLYATRAADGGKAAAVQQKGSVQS